jgi:S1-C subfamily serine protease/regulator of sirC expression with transglutaminase-like and TPR domain
MTKLPLFAFLACLMLATEHAIAADGKPTEENGGKSVADIAAEVKPSLVKVIQVGRQGVGGLGSGFVMSDDGLIATNRHVIGDARRIKVETSDGKVEEVTEIFASDARLDLAILRIARKDLRPLPLGDSEKLRQGDRIVAMGNPQGLAFSVVEGVISEPQRDVDGVKMIQVAVPIEPGNSGGPLLDRQGRVLGLLTLKSARTDNLGFAMPVNELKKLIAKPNPVPMSRWLTIGVLNPRVWKPLMGAQWTQRAGIVSVEQPGDGFGGRALCLWMAEKPGAKFEAEVTVKLDDEAGAAGLTFCADGGERHYGFYPTGGKLRLTRFDGADVFSWKILADAASEAYRAGDWNTLRVRVDDERIQCFVNGRQVFDQEEKDLRGGHAGLCKFRTTVASYKGFRLGNDLAEKTPDPALTKDVQKSMNGFLAGKMDRGHAMDTLLQDPALSRRILDEKRKALEKNAAALRDLENDLHRGAVVRELTQQLSQPDERADLLRCALLISQHDNPEIDLGSYEREFARMVDELKDDAEIKKGTLPAVKRLTKFLFEQNGFHGSRHDYDSRSNSYINEVLDDREGLPITLSIIFVELASRLGVKNVAGIPLPSRFMVGYREKSEGEFSMLDVFDGGKPLTFAEAKTLVAGDSAIPDETMQPAKKKDIILRMIRNLIGRAVASPNPAKEAPPYFNLLLALDPSAFRERLTRARMRELSGDTAGAAEDLEWLVAHPPKEFDEPQHTALGDWLARLRRR